jgi:predicted RNA-binding protein with PIN domain
MPSPRIILVDGYNVINRVPELTLSLNEGLESARRRLALQVSRWRHEHPAVECLVVFDGDSRYAGAREQLLAGVRCLFSKASHGGDDEIIRFVRDYRGKATDIVVVSDDNNVRNNSRAHGASVEPASFIMTGKERRSGARRELRDGGKAIDKDTAARVDRELRKKFGL